MAANGGADRRIAWSIALALFGLNMLCWNGAFHSSDGLSMYAVADSLARYGRFDTEQVRWLGLQQGMYGPDGLLYSRKGLATSLMALPLALAGMILPGLGPVHTSLLLMPLVTAAGGALLYLAGRRAFPGLPRVAAVLASLAWGLGSLAWPYSKTFFSEPLTALSTIGAMERLLAFSDAEPRSRGELAAALGLGCWLGLGVLARLAHAIVLPVFVLALLFLTWRRYGSGVTRSHLRPLVAVALPLITVGALSLWYNWARFGSPLVTGYLPEESFSAVWWQGLAGLSISPGRGLIWYVPWLVMVVMALPRAWRKSPVATATAAASCVLYLLLYAKWHMWHGGYCWGPRFLVPVLPLLGLLAVPAAARWPRLFGSLAALGVGVNLIGVAWDFDQHQEALLGAGLPLFDPRTFFAPQYAQISGVLRLGEWQTLDVVWMAGGRLHPALAMLALALAAIGVLGGLLVASGRSLRARKVMGREWGTNLQWVVVLLAITTYASLWQAGTAEAAGYRSIADAITMHSPPGTMIWNNDHPYIATFLNLYRGRAAILGVFEPDETLSPETRQRLSSLADLSQPVWVIERGSVGTAGALESIASQHRGLVDEVSVATSTHWGPGSPEEREPLKAMLYFDTPSWQVQTLDVTMGPGGQPLIRLVEAGLSPGVKPGELVALRLVWEALGPLTESYLVSVQLLGPEGTPVAMRVGPPQNGQAPTTAWQPGQPVTETYAFSLGADAAPGEYEFLVIVQSVVDSVRLRTTDGRDEVVVGPVSIVS
jgi:hypothetical protein